MAAATTTTTAAIPQGVVDPTKPAKYPVILSDALLGKSPQEILTAIRYNHKPTLSSDTAPSTAKLQPVPAASSSTGAETFDLTYSDDGGRYGFNGTRTVKDNQYVLIFDPERKAFVLHRLDSTFNMNITRTPSNNNAASLREEYPHLDSSVKVSTDKKGGKAGGAAAKAGKGKNAAKNAGMVQSKRSASGAASTSSAAPASSSKAKAEAAKAQAASKPSRSRSPADSEDDDSDDGDLLVEWGEDMQPSSSMRSMPPRTASPLPPVRRFSEFLANQAASGGESDEDADAEDEDDLILEEDAGDSSGGGGGGGFKLPSPVRRQDSMQHNAVADDADEEEPPEDDELMAMLEQEMDMDSESSVSEED